MFSVTIFPQFILGTNNKDLDHDIGIECPRLFIVVGCVCAYIQGVSPYMPGFNSHMPVPFVCLTKCLL